MNDKIRILMTISSLDDFSKLDSEIRGTTITSIKNLLQDKMNVNSHLHKMKTNKNIFTFNVSRKYGFRGKMEYVPSEGSFYLLTLGSHSDIYDFKHKLINKDQAIEVISSEKIKAESLAGQYLRRDLVDLGVPYNMVDDILNLNFLEEFEEEYYDKLPELVFNRIFFYLDPDTRYSFEEIINEFSDSGEKVIKEPVSTLDNWRVSLSDLQIGLTQDDYNGPTLIKGVAGTGKSVVVIYRAKELAQKNKDKRILITTYNNHLPRDIKDNLSILCKNQPELLDKIDIFNIDDWNKKFLESQNAKRSVDYTKVSECMEKAINENDPEGKFGKLFYEDEWKKIFIPQNIKSEEDFLKVDRTGRKIRLSKDDRKLIFKVLDSYSNLLIKENLHDNVTAKQESLELLKNLKSPIYRNRAESPFFNEW